MYKVVLFLFENIILPLDGSHSCLRARELAAVLSKKYGSKITAIHVMSHDFMHPELKANFDLPPLILEELNKAYQKNGEKILKNAEEFFKEEDISISTILERAENPADRILQKAKELNSNLVIMGNIAEEQECSYSLGSVAEKVSLHAQCSVLVAKRKTQLTKLLVAFDNSEQANKALAIAVDLCRHFGSKMTALNVENAELHRLEPAFAQEVGEKILDKATTTIEGVTCDRRLAFGKPSEMILKIAKIDNYDLILLGSRGLSSIKRFFTGSVSTYVSMNAQCSVMLVR
jgi:nucleotide-binding universal stress UspA family protein